LKRLSQKNTSKKTLGLYNKSKRKLCAKEKKDIFDIKRREEGIKGIHRGTVEKRVY